jgi:hypothetical protein
LAFALESVSRLPEIEVLAFRPGDHRVGGMTRVT